MVSHVLIEKACRFQPASDQPIVGWTYRRDLGAWVDSRVPSRTLASVMADPQPQPRPPQPPAPLPPMSKKADIETGEDMKGE